MDIVNEPNSGDATHGTSGPLVLRPGDPGYEDELAGFQTGFAPRPDAVFAASSAADVAAAVRYAARRGLPVRVQATGHGLPGPSEGGVLITTRRLDGVSVDPVARTARVQAGARWGQVVTAAAPHGLAPLNGSAPSVGVVGYVLGGGLGILAREFGYAADHVRSLDVVTADGRARHVTPESEPDLYWALLGGGGGLGVVTALETDLVPVATLYGGSVSFDGREVGAATVLRAWREWTRTVPEGLTSSFAAVPYPDLPTLPRALRGRYVVSVRVAHTGADGERITAPLRRIGPPLADSLRRMPYAESHTIHSDPDVPHAYYGDSAVLRELDLDAAGELLARTGPDAGGPLCVVQVNQLGGALAAGGAANAVPHRDGRFLVRLLAVGDREAARERLDAAFAPLAPVTAGRALNFAFGAGNRTDGLWDAKTRKRLAAIRSRYDPASLFGGDLGGPGAC
ncbi:FAD-binding oxidoreductase [Streptomyces sp. AC627_RSS907]|uniref:FAD-binding oxidoreductase n=1 Tax=Streptomyces sp. AC627_RSS907 TaxID=2823684 RepID=UPI0020B65158|nr:FAD-binding protein [Streptomyces sp. AC627_RSS907]